jgi:hypothetical protein
LGLDGAIVAAHWLLHLDWPSWWFESISELSGRVAIPIDGQSTIQVFVSDSAIQC